jgi:hypothetical protein
MVECVASEPPYADRVPQQELYGVPNIVAIVAAVIDSDGDVPQPIGGATIEVRAARATQLIELDIDRAHTLGRVVLAADGSAVPAGGTVAVAGVGPDGRDITYRTTIAANGAFASATPEFGQLLAGTGIDILYVGEPGFAPAGGRVVLY